MPEKTVSDYLSRWNSVPFDEFLAELQNDMRSDVGAIINVAEAIWTKDGPGKPVDREWLQMCTDIILQRASDLRTILDAVSDYSRQYRANQE